MRVLLTEGRGSRQTLVPLLLARGDTPVILDIRAPADPRPGAAFIPGSVLDRPNLQSILTPATVSFTSPPGMAYTKRVVRKRLMTFFDLNVRGTFEVFEAAAVAASELYISTTSVYRPDNLYGRAKLLAERIADDYVKYRYMNVITLRPRAFIPFWNRAAYANYIESLALEGRRARR